MQMGYDVKSDDIFNWEIALAAQTACILEADAPKPGNVNRYYDFNDATLEDFHLSALAIGRPFGYIQSLGVGKTVLEAVRAVRALVATNTNLGILLLLAPLALAWSQICAGINRRAGGRERNIQDAQFSYGLGSSVSVREWQGLWKTEVQRVLDRLTAEDTAFVYQAIREASPAGMGKVAQYDINEQAPSITLLEAMKSAAARDLIAQQYADGFSLVLGQGREMFSAALKKRLSLPEAIKETFLFLLSLNADSLISRKLGPQRSEEIRQLALSVRKGQMCVNELDRILRSEKHALNPGTTADLTTAVVFVQLLEDNIFRIR